MASYASSDDEMPRIVGSTSPIRRQNLFDSDSEDDDRGRGRVSEAEEDNSLNRQEGGASGRVYKNSDEEEAEEERKREEKRKKDEKKKPRGPVRRQMISEDMLIGKNGISTIPEIFKDFKFRGKGREREDLDDVLSKLEHWIHLLHPKHPFDQCLQRIEFLGGKRKIIKTHLKKIRMGMLNNFDENDVVADEDDMMNNIDAAELAESASAFVNEGELASMESQIPSTSSMVVATTQMNNDNSEFPDDDDDYFESVDESAVVKTKAVVNDLDEMDMDIEDMPPDNDGEDDDMFIKQMEAQLKRAEMVESQQQKQSDAKDGELSQEDKQPEQAPASSSVVSDGPVTQETMHVASEETNANLRDKDQQEKTDLEDTRKAEITPIAPSTESETDKVNDDDDGIMLDDLCDNDDNQ